MIDWRYFEAVCKMPRWAKALWALYWIAIAGGLAIVLIGAPG